MLNISTNQVDQLLARGNALANAGRLADAERDFRQALALNPNHAPALEALGLLLARTDRREEAANTLHRAIELRPTPEAYLHLGQLLSLGGRRPDAIDVFQKAVVAFPNDFRIAAELGRALNQEGYLDEAEAVFEKALIRWPHNQLLVYYFGSLLFFKRKLDQAVALYHDCLKHHSREEAIHSALLFTLHFIPGLTAPALLKEHQEWNRIHAAPLAKSLPPFTNSREPGRRLRIGYVSPDFRNHGIGRFMAPILAHHDRSQFEIFAYSDAILPDDFTQRIRGHADHWRQTYGTNDEQAAKAIRADQIDILVDLTMHMPAHRLLAFARRPAPVQATYLAYCGTTGLAAMNYRLSDLHLDPPGTDGRYSERTIRLPSSWWLYEAPEMAPAIAERSPAAPVVFGSLNNFAKVSDGCLAAWAEILRGVPNSRLILHAPPGKWREQILAVMLAADVMADRIEFAPRLSLQNYFALYNRVDIALDSFPYAGGTTTCDAMWMGAPVVTLAGDLAVARGGVSILNNIGLPEFIAQTPEVYVRTAVNLAKDPSRRAELRHTLRERMRRSPLMNAVDFTRDFEAALRQMWQNWRSGPGV